MRFKLTLEVLPEKYGRDIPINYQYEMSAAIYRILSSANEEYSSWLHENGFVCEDGDKVKRFKLFTYSRLFIKDYLIDKEKERIKINSDCVEWYVSFLPETSTKSFVNGIFKNQIIRIGDNLSSVEMRIKDVVIMDSLNYRKVINFRTISPICVSVNDRENGQRYLSPNDINYTHYLLNNLKSRYKSLYGADYDKDEFIDFKVIDNPKSVLVTIKKCTPSETKIRGYLFSFELSLPEPLMQIAYESGLGEKGSLGFGMIIEK